MDLLTIADFAEKAGVTPQAIYKRLKTDLAPYLIEENGVKLLNTDALNLFRVNQQSKEKQAIKDLETQLAELQAENAKLKQDNLSLTEKLAANSEKLLEILDRQTQQQENYQVLVAQVQSSLIQLLPTGEPPTQQLNEVENNFNKPSLFKRIFKRP
jgi:predicted transcriptional regulator